VEVVPAVLVQLAALAAGVNLRLLQTGLVVETMVVPVAVGGHQVPVVTALLVLVLVAAVQLLLVVDRM